MSQFAGKTISSISLMCDGNTPAGRWDIYFRDIAVVSADSSVRAIYNGTTDYTMSVWGASGVTGIGSSVDDWPNAGANALDTTVYYHGDHLGTSRLITSAATGWPIWQGTFLPFGAEFQPQMTTNNYKFTGMENDSETGLNHTWFRQQSPVLGRWLTPDPAGMAAVDLSNPQSLNRYAYALNAPTIYVDPLGLNVNGMVCVNTGYNDPNQDGKWVATGIYCIGGGGGGTTPGGGGGGGGGGTTTTQAQKKPSNQCPSRLRSTINKGVLWAMVPQVMSAAKGILQAARGGVVQFGLGAAGATSGLPGRLGIAGEGSVALAFDSKGNVALAISVAGGRGAGSGYTVGGQFSTSPFAQSIFDLQGPSGAIGGGGGAGLAGAVELSSNGGGTATETVGFGQGAFGLSFMGGPTYVIPLVCQ